MDEKTVYRIKKPSDDDAPSSERHPCLIMIEGDFLGEVYPVDKDLIILGRSDEVDIVLSDTSVSRRHAMIERRDGRFYVSDLDSTNGTEVNGEPTQDAPLEDGDKLRVGDIGFKFSFQDAVDTDYHRRLRQMAVKDGLTRIYNKRYFLEAVEKEFSFARRHQNRLSVILFDIDHFKRLNDTYGHPAGDHVLKTMASLIEKGVRGYDVFARYGGEEFVFLLRGSTLEEAVLFADRIRQTIEKGAFVYDDEKLNVTISVGVTTYEGDEAIDNHEDLINKADQQLYEAKKAGRNCTRFTKP